MTHELVLPSVRFDELLHVGLSEWYHLGIIRGPSGDLCFFWPYRVSLLAYYEGEEGREADCDLRQIMLDHHLQLKYSAAEEKCDLEP